MTDQPKKILVVEDDEFLRDLYITLTEKEGYVVESANNGITAMEKMQGGGFDLVLLDIMLPQLDGVSILKKLQQKPPQNPNKTIVLLTNIGEDATITEAMRYGASAYLLKSQLSPDEVVKRVKEFLGENESLKN